MRVVNTNVTKVPQVQVDAVHVGDHEEQVRAQVLGQQFAGQVYLIYPVLRGLSVKIRSGQMREMKQYHGSPGILDVASRACGRIASWRK